MAKVLLNPKKRMALQQASVIIFLGIAAVIMLALLSYDPRDPGVFSHSSDPGVVRNLARTPGALLADFLIGLLGYFAYGLPVVLVVLGLVSFRIGPYMKNPNNPVGGINDVISAIGAVILMIAGSGLAHLLFEGSGPYGGGGLLGRVIGNLVAHSFLGTYGAALLLTSLFLGGLTLVTDVSWPVVAEKVGDFVLLMFNKAQDIKSHQGEEGRPDLLGKLSSAVGAGKGSIDKASGWLNRIKGEGGAKAKVEPVADGIDLTEMNAPGGRAEPTLGVPDFVNGGAEGSADKQADAKPKKGKGKTEKALDAPDEDFLRSVADELPPAGKNGMLVLPRLTLLNPPPSERVTQPKERLNELAEKLVEALGHYNVPDVKVVAQDPGPVITRFELELPDGTKASKVSGLASDLARNMCVASVRVVEVIPGRPTIGIEIPNDRRDVVTMSEMLAAPVYKKNHSPLTLALGKDIAGNPVVADLARMPHLLVAGTTGSGKSVFINAVLMSLLYKATPEDVRMIMIDPKMLELSSYEDIPHLLAPVVTDMKHAANALRWCVAEMERRYLLMSKLKVRNIAGFNEKVREAQERGDELMDPLWDPTTSMDGHPQPLKTLPYIVVIVDEFADMMMVVGKKVEELIARLAQKARASGIHLILATQRPSVDVITGLIKANIPTRIAFQVSTKIDSRTILDQGGAEQLLGYGDMLYMPPGTSLPLRVHGALVTDREVEDVANYLKLQGEPDYIADVLADTSSPSDAIPGLEPLTEREGESDPLYDEAVAVVTESRRASISYLQRRLKVGYNRAARMIEDMENAGVVSAVLSNGTRDVLAASPVRD
ncbi:MAG: DNA translocase FtsK 4TM domain-containing protein [Gammaproteobacteria bacterium]|nr:DNA translocase FtsK 4TM domain-containing protein [Gammaproteobacteria bacterium]MBU1723716.1 DNA translocase FtsK 4TM domain-containing protein [Gammaproteobacteria bacterium]MBU2004800.1 DNA translocase FtsK 4TM domain-containing protein [Gammaproteobacteria bacterium]